ncbi:DNA ligase (plasmid) [Aneurinibacillus sp. Ricciae_BoGa-3]|uniref:ATP-dependent DNA ligase n=1 Tax=Aneurinibacillus sp. Ricciae_BoGa-3 TaxID=3022697 RepID=UPI0023410C4A|nr:DNA ligase [Aneurinibacillus sp. Ricciae_BoGa-3]WCK57371.1 DNA ligase [Aneurinibacillus sp. Ricciae_BoGa-3]
MLFEPIKPMLLTMGEKEVVDDDNTLFDIKWDGWRLLIHKQGDRIEAYTRHGNVISNKLPELQEAIHHIKAHTAILDCEGVVLRDGVSNFDDFAYRGRLSNPVKIQRAMHTQPITFVAFDVLATDKPHIGESLMFRRQRLQSIIEPSDVLITTPSVMGSGKQLFDLTKQKGMEGIVGKKINSTYQIDKRSEDWIKYKFYKFMDTVILGYKENPFTMIVGCQFKTVKNKAIASVEFGFKPEEKQAFRKIAKDMVVKEDRGVKWIEPVLCCRVQYLERTDNHHLRIVSFKGFNFDKKAEDCKWAI